MTYENASLLTKRALAQSLRDSLQSKQYDKITISDIVSKCGLNRKTFYYHFEDKNALLRWIVECDAERINERIDNETDLSTLVTMIIDEVERERDACVSLLNSVGSDDLSTVFEKSLEKMGNVYITQSEHKYNKTIPEDVKNFLEKFFSSAILGVTIQYIKSMKKLSEKERAFLIDQFTFTIENSLKGIIEAL